MKMVMEVTTCFLKSLNNTGKGAGVAAHLIFIIIPANIRFVPLQMLTNADLNELRKKEAEECNGLLVNNARKGRR